MWLFRWTGLGLCNVGGGEIARIVPYPKITPILVIGLSIHQDLN